MAAGASVALQTWWPTLLFAWLLLSRYVLPRWNIGGADEHLDAGELAAAGDPHVMDRTGTVQVAARLGLEYGFADMDGKVPRPLTLADV